MSDGETQKDSYLYKLSKCKSFGWFKQVIFCSSHQDNYAPNISAQVLADGSRKNLHTKMAGNVMRCITEGGVTEKITRIDVDFKIEEQNLDALIGRTAHILLVECETLLDMLVQR